MSEEQTSGTVSLCVQVFTLGAPWKQNTKLFKRSPRDPLLFTYTKCIRDVCWVAITHKNKVDLQRLTWVRQEQHSSQGWDRWTPNRFEGSCEKGICMVWWWQQGTKANERAKSDTGSPRDLAPQWCSRRINELEWFSVYFAIQIWEPESADHESWHIGKGVDLASHSQNNCKDSGGQQGLSQKINYLTKMLPQEK